MVSTTRSEPCMPWNQSCTIAVRSSIPGSADAAGPSFTSEDRRASRRRDDSSVPTGETAVVGEADAERCPFLAAHEEGGAGGMKRLVVSVDEPESGTLELQSHLREIKAGPLVVFDGDAADPPKARRVCVEQAIHLAALAVHLEQIDFVLHIEQRSKRVRERSHLDSLAVFAHPGGTRSGTGWPAQY